MNRFFILVCLLTALVPCLQSPRFRIGSIKHSQFSARHFRMMALDDIADERDSDDEIEIKENNKPKLTG